MKYAFAVAAVSGLILGTAAVQAADLFVEPEVATAVVAEGFDWSGIQLGIQGSYLSGTASWQNTTLDERSADGDFGGGALGVTASFDKAFGNIVVGVAAQYNISDIDGQGDFPDNIDYFDINVDAFGSVDGRIGIALDRVMPYLTGGVAFAHASHTYFGVDDFGDSMFVGWDIGVGVQVAVTDNVIANVAARYADYGSVSYEPVGGSAVADHDISLTATQLSAGLSFKF